MRIHSYNDENHGYVVTTTLTLPTAYPHQLTLGRDSGDNTFELLSRADIELGAPSFDGVWRIDGPAFETRMALSNTAREQIMLAGPDRLKINGKVMTVLWEDRHPPLSEETCERVMSCLKLRSSLQEGGWGELAERVGLRVVHQGLLEGLVRGVHVEVRLGSGGTRIHATIPSPLVATRKDASGPAVAQPWPTHNPVLDQLLTIGGDPSLAGPLLRREGLVGGRPWMAREPADSRRRLAVGPRWPDGRGARRRPGAGRRPGSGPQALKRTRPASPSKPSSPILRPQTQPAGR